MVSLLLMCSVKKMFLKVAICKPVQGEECFAYWMLSRKIDKSHSFNI